MNPDFTIFKSYDGIITARTVEPVAFPTSSDPVSVDPTAEKYNAIAVNTDDVLTLTQHLPIRRISKGCRIIPAEVGDPCTITLNGKDVFLFAYTEGIPFKEACP